MNTVNDQSGWRPLPLLLLHLAAAALLASWWFEGSRLLLWQPLDDGLFRLLNGSLGRFGEGWSTFWAFANTKQFDALAAALMLALFLPHILGDGRRHMAERMADLLLMLLMIAVVLAVVEETLMNVKRPSPTLVLGTDYWLTQMHPQFKLKDASGSSFPSDHGMVVLLWAAYLGLTAGWRLGLAGAALAVVLVMPRMVGGGHWFTDTAVGGAFVALIALAWLFCTPLRAHALPRLTPLMRPLARLAEALLGRFWKP